MAQTAEVLHTISLPAQRVRDAVAQSPDTRSAADLLESWARSDRELFDYLVKPWLTRACEEAVRTVTRSERAAICRSWTAPNYTLGGNGHRVHTLGRSLLDFPLPGGMRLRDARKDDLLGAVKFYRSQAVDMAAKASWLEAIAERVGRKQVGNVFDDETLPPLE